MYETKRILSEIDYDDLGDVIWEELNAYDNSSTDMGRYAILCLEHCETEAEFEAANNMMTALTGWSIESLIKKVKGK